jgi:hypothetical protein
MKQKSLVVIFFTLLAASLFSSCKDQVTGDTSEIVFPASNVSYGGQVQPLFDRGCAFSGCHAGDTPPLGLNLESYQNALSSDPGVILPRDTTNSRIMWRIEGTHGVRQEPPNRAPLTPNQIKGIGTWIMEGAKNN